MGGCGAFLKTGGFSKIEYKNDGFYYGYKVIRRIDVAKEQNLPWLSNTPGTIYVKLDNNRKFSQLRAFNLDRTPKYDIDFGRHGSSKPFLHVHYYRQGVRSNDPSIIDKKHVLYNKYKELLKGLV